MASKESYIKLLEEQLARINDKDFDLSSWKKATSLLLASIFGPNSAEVTTIDKIDYAYSSWALRDESGTTDPIKKECKTTLELILRKLEISDQFQLQEDKNVSNNFQFVWLPFEDELTGATLKKLKASLCQTSVSEDEIAKLLKDLPGQTTIDILSRILVSPEFKNWIIS